MPKQPYKRSRYFVRKKFQLRYIGIILGAVLLSAAISGYTIYYSAWTMLGDSLAKVYPQGRLVAIFNYVNIKVAVNLFFVLMLCTGIGILTSHKIAGPIYRMIKFLDGMVAGDYSQRIHLRKGDELQDVADAINRLAEKLNAEKKPS
ncbi:MAG: hypothetical protein JW994_00355 [Candidatus Omnitrophica bacterium]|nr:hypothetical protein [Candidatus Omnitrophota bacterium]